MAPERADRVLRTARMEPAARPEERAHRDAVRHDEDDQRCLHASDNVFQCFSSEPRRTVPVSRSAVARATTTKSSPASRSWFSRKLSRTSRFKRLRRFARRTRFFATAIPSRAGPALRARARTEKFRSDERTGSSNTRWKSCRVRSRRSPPNERSRSSVRRSGREARPALGSPRLDDPPPRARAHLGAEATTAFRTANAWLKRSLHPVRTTVWAGGSARAAKDTDGGGKFQRAHASRRQRHHQRERHAGARSHPGDAPDEVLLELMAVVEAVVDAFERAAAPVPAPSRRTAEAGGGEDAPVGLARAPSKHPPCPQESRPLTRS